MAKAPVNVSDLEEAPVVETPPKAPKRSYDQAARDYRRPSHDTVTAHDPRIRDQKTTLRVVKYSNGYLTGVSPRGGQPVKEKEMTIAEAYRVEARILSKYRSRLTHDEPDITP